MSTENTLRSFLVKLGFKVDLSSFKRMEDALERMTTKIGTIAEAVAGVVTASAGMVTLFADHMEKLYFASQRSGATVANLQAIGYAASQIGVSADTAQASVEHLGEELQTNPGLSALLGGMGIKTKGQDPTKIFLNFLEKIKSMPRYEGMAYASMLGISQGDFLMYMKNLPEMEKQYQARLAKNKAAGINPDKQAEQAHKLMVRLRKLEAAWTVLASSIEQKFLPVASKLLDWAQGATMWFARLNTATNGWLGSLVALGAQLAVVYTAWKKVRGLFGGGAAAAAGGAAETGAEGATAGAVVARGGLLRRLATNPYVAGLLALFHSGKLNTGENAWLANLRRVQAADRAKGQHAGPYNLAGPLPLGLRLNNPGNLRFAGQAGATLGTNGFARFASPNAGLAAMARQLTLYGSRGIDTISGIVNKYAPAGDHNNVPAYIAAISKSLGMGANEHLNLANKPLLARLMGAMILHEQGRDPFSHSQLMAAANSTRLGGVTINQVTNINVHGDSDPRNTAMMVASQQRDVNGSLVRLGLGAVR